MKKGEVIVLPSALFTQAVMPAHLKADEIQDHATGIAKRQFMMAG